MNWEVPVSNNDEKHVKPVERAKQDFARATERLVETAKRHATTAITDITDHVKASAHGATASLAADVRQVSAAVASGVREVKSELHLPQTVKDHPYAWIAGSVALGAAGLLMLRGVARAVPRAVAKTAGGGLGGRLAMTALDVGISYWLMRRQTRKAAEIAAPEGQVALH